MNSSQARCRNEGCKKIIVDKKGVLDNLREHEISKSFSQGNVCYSCRCLCNYFFEGGNLNSRDSKTGETFLHVLCDHAHMYLTADGTRLMYMLSVKVDLDVPDANGDTVLHKMVRVPGAWRCIVALMRCGACPLKKNKAGRTPEEEILYHKNPGWEENLHWLRKFLPGLWAAVTAKNPDPVLIERLLRYWCRTTRIVGSETMNLKYLVHMCETQLDTVCILEKYENTNEMALAMLSGKSHFIELWKISENLQKVNINTKDHSYQFNYRDYPTAPRPLLAAVWEMEKLELLQSFLELHPDVTVKYTFESEATSPPKPLFFQLVNPKLRPRDEAIASLIFRVADLSIRNLYGQTVLIEAMYNGETEGVIRAILNSGINLADRDCKGRTARDHATLLDRGDYRELIDSHVIELIRDCDIDRLERLVLQLYDHVIPASQNWKMIASCRHKSSKQLMELLKNVNSTQNRIRQLFSLVKAGNKAQVIRLMNQKYASARDKAGRTLLHAALQYLHGSSKGNNSTCTPKPERNLRNSNNVFGDEVDIDRLSLSFEHGSSLQISETIQLHQQDSPPTPKPFCSWKEKRKKFCSFRPICHGNSYFTPDHLGIIKYFVKEYPLMLGLKNNLSQTPLHYAHIFTAGRDITELLVKAGDCTQMKDVYEFVPDDYDKNLCGEQTFNVRRKHTVDLDLDVFLTEVNFEENFHEAINTGNLERLKKVVAPLFEFSGEARFSPSLFDCLDRGHINLASYLVKAGFLTNISKQYDICDPDNPMCAMMECSHAVLSFRQRALDLGATDLVKLIDEQQRSTQLIHTTVT